MTVKKQCLAKIQDYIDDCDEYKDPEHRYAALVLSIVKRDIELNIEEPVAATPNDYVPWRMPIQPDIPYVTTFTDIPDPCKNCPTHPSNGGSGICNCTLGLPKITY